MVVYRSTAAVCAWTEHTSTYRLQLQLQLRTAKSRAIVGAEASVPTCRHGRVCNLFSCILGISFALVVVEMFTTVAQVLNQINTLIQRSFYM